MKRIRNFFLITTIFLLTLTSCIPDTPTEVSQEPVGEVPAEPAEDLTLLVWDQFYRPEESAVIDQLNR